MSDPRPSSIIRADASRGPVRPAPGAAGHREWMAFCVATPALELLLVLAYLGRIEKPTVAKPLPPLPAARVIALVRTSDGRWESFDGDNKDTGEEPIKIDRF